MPQTERKQMLLYIHDTLISDTDVPATVKLLYGLLYRLKQDTGDNYCRLSARYLAQLLGLQRNSIPRAMKILSDKGYVRITEGASVKNRLQYIYEIVDVDSTPE